ncbi:hypothetical protein ABK046_50935, partial [Streptomyces caeruleatus]
ALAATDGEVRTPSCPCGPESAAPTRPRRVGRRGALVRPRDAAAPDPLSHAYTIHSSAHHH